MQVEQSLVTGQVCCIVCTVNEQPIYRKYTYVFDTSSPDVIIESDNDCKELIKQTYASIEANHMEYDSTENNKIFEL